MALSDWQYEYNSLTFGEDTVYPVNTVDGLGPVGIRVATVPKGGANGSWMYGLRKKERHIVFNGWIYVYDDTGDVEDAIADYETAFEPQATALPLTFKRPGMSEKTIDCIVGDAPWTLELNMLGRGLASFKLELIAGDPTINDSA